MSEFQFRGGGHIWVGGRFVRASWPFLVFSLTGDTLSIWITPAFIAKLLGPSRYASDAPRGFRGDLANIRRIVVDPKSVVVVGVDGKPNRIVCRRSAIEKVVSQLELKGAAIERVRSTYKYVWTRHVK
jgi:hypothetical protein